MTIVANDSLTISKVSDGVGVTSTVITFANSTSGTTPPTSGWTATVPTVAAGSYLWTKTVWAYTDNISETGYSVAMMGLKGEPGANAPTITNVQDQIYLSTSNTAQSGGSWGILIPAWSSGKYYWSRVATTFSNGTTTYSTPVLDEALNQATTNQVKVTQLKQDLDGFKTTVSNTYLSKSDASGTYADKISVASQITQSATAVTSNVQSWTNNKLTAYSTTQQTATSITNAVADKADKTQITQLSDNINLKVSKGDVVSSINQEAGQIVFNANKLVLNANTTEITGNAFIRGDMIINGSIKTEKLEVNNLSAISSDLGDVTAGTIKLMDDNWVINGQPKMYGIYQSKFGLISSGPSFSRSAIISNTKMGVANLNRGELRFTVNDYTEDLKNVQEAGMSVQNNAFIKFNSYENGKDVLLIGSSGDIVFSGDVVVNGKLTLPTKSWSGELGGGITLSLRKKGTTVEYSFGGGISSNILAGSNLVKLSVPSEFCPTKRYSLVGHMSGGWNSFHIDIQSSGVCQWWGPTTNTGAPRGSGTYPLD